jgi:hypothetical protein
MGKAVRKIVRIKPGGVIEIRVDELVPGTVAEVIVLIEGEGNSTGANRSQEFAALFKDTQALPHARAVSEDEIAAEVAAYRAGRA